MKYIIIEGALIYNVRKLEIPAYFFKGRHDYVTLFELVHQYYSLLEAPHKEIIWFENSAYFPFFEEPEKFASE